MKKTVVSCQLSVVRDWKLEARLPVFCLWSFIFCLWSLTCLAQPVIPPTTNIISGATTANMEGILTLDLRNIDVVDALKYLALKAKMNIVTSKKVSGRINLLIESAPIKDIFDVMLRSNGLAYEARGNIYNVMTEEEYMLLYGQPFSDARVVKIFHLKYAIPEQIFNLCDTLKSAIGRVLVDQESGAVAVMDSPHKLIEIEAAIAKFETQNTTRVFTVNYANAKELAEIIKTQVDAKKVGSVRADERSSQLIVQALPDRMKQVEELIKKLDKKTKEVLIDVKIIKVKLSKDTTESVEWEGLFQVTKKQGLTYLGSYPFSAVQETGDVWRSRQQVLADVGNVGSYPFSGTTSNYSASRPSGALENLHIGSIGKSDMDGLIKLFQDVGETQIIATPKLVVTNNQEAKIHVGEKQAYVTTTTTTGQTTSTVAEDVNFVDIGTQMSVTPVINEDGYITLKIKAEISSVISTLITPTNNKIPIIDSSLAETTVMSKDQVTIVIGGLREEDKTLVATRTPVLSSIPLIGRLFTSRNPTKTRTELMILITPTILSGDILVNPADKAVGREEVKPVKDYSREAEMKPAVSVEKHERKIPEFKIKEKR